MNVLLIGIHMDDCEFGAGGTAGLLAQRGANVTILNIKPYMHYKGGVPGANEQSCHAAELLGAKKIILPYSETKYYKNNEKTTRLTEEVIRDIKPDIIITMHPKDNHIEHVECAYTAREAIFAAAVDGIYPNEIYTCEMGPLQSACFFIPHLYIDISPAEQPLKDCMFSFSQDHANGEWLWREKMRIAKLRGHESGRDTCEGFQILKLPSGNNDFLLRETLPELFRWGGNPMYPAGGQMFF